MTVRVVDKLGKMERVAEHTLRLVLRHGLDAITHAKVARAAGVSRPWLYKYIGRERSDLVASAADHFGLRLAELDQRPRCDTRAHWTADSVEGLATMVQHAARAPWVLPLYYRHIGTGDPIGERIAELERRYLDASTLELTRAGIASGPRARTIAELVHAMRIGLVHRHQLTGLCGDGDLRLTSSVFERWLVSL